jgi:hypothetical protein
LKCTARLTQKFVEFIPKVLRNSYHGPAPKLNDDSNAFDLERQWFGKLPMKQL